MREQNNNRTKNLNRIFLLAVLAVLPSSTENSHDDSITIAAPANSQKQPTIASKIQASTLDASITEPEAPGIVQQEKLLETYMPCEGPYAEGITSLSPEIMEQHLDEAIEYGTIESAFQDYLLLSAGKGDLRQLVHYLDDKHEQGVRLTDEALQAFQNIVDSGIYNNLNNQVLEGMHDTLSNLTAHKEGFIFSEAAKQEAYNAIIDQVRTDHPQELQKILSDRGNLREQVTKHTSYEVGPIPIFLYGQEGDTDYERMQVIQALDAEEGIHMPQYSTLFQELNTFKEKVSNIYHKLHTTLEKESTHNAYEECLYSTPITSPQTVPQDLTF